MHRYEVLCGDAVECLKKLPNGIVQCVVTSPPYFGLRSYSEDPAEIGKEKTMAAYVENLVAVFREVRRVLRDDGLIFCNLGDSFAGKELPPKSLCGIPWRVAFALQDDGWILRSDIIWDKPAPMPESVTDRCTKSHEYIFMLAKQQKYYYDSEAVKEDSLTTPVARDKHAEGYQADYAKGDRFSPGSRVYGSGTTKNRRDVWTINTQPSSLPHFAMMPEKLAETCILAGTSETGCCSQCGSPWVRVVERGLTAHDGNTESNYPKGTTANRLALLRQAARERGEEYVSNKQTTGWQPSCTCGAGVVPQVILDPFSGMATTGVVALKLGRHYIGCELNPEYAALSEKRLRDIPLTIGGLNGD